LIRIGIIVVLCTVLTISNLCGSEESFFIPYGSNYFPLNYYPPTNTVFSEEENIGRAKDVDYWLKKKFPDPLPLKIQYSIISSFQLSLYDTQADKSLGSDFSLWVQRWKRQTDRPRTLLDFKLDYFHTYLRTDEGSETRLDLLILYSFFGKKFNYSVGVRQMTYPSSNINSGTLFISNWDYAIYRPVVVGLYFFYPIINDLGLINWQMTPYVKAKVGPVFFNTDLLEISLKLHNILTANSLDTSGSYQVFDWTADYQHNALSLFVRGSSGERIGLLDEKGIKSDNYGELIASTFGMGIGFNFLSKSKLCFFYDVASYLSPSVEAAVTHDLNDYEAITKFSLEYRHEIQ